MMHEASSQRSFQTYKFPVLNAENRSHGTELGLLHEAEVIDEAIKDAQETKQEDELSPLKL